MKSMTAFGSFETDHNGYSYCCEVRSLNSRFVEVHCKGPRFLTSLEPEIIKEVKKSLTRGKVEIYFDIKSQNSQKGLPSINKEALDHYKNEFINGQTHLSQAIEGYSLQDLNLKLLDFVRLEGVFGESQSESNSDKVQKHKEPIFICLTNALENLIKERESEGSELKKALIMLVDELEGYKIEVDQMRSTIQSKSEDSFKEKINQIISRLELDQVDLVPTKERIATEIAIASDKADIEEEIRRLEAHIVAFRKDCDSKEPIGRKLDFLCQELNREVNTTSNKLLQIDASALSLNMKQAVERLRQQVQNIE